MIKLKAQKSLGQNFLVDPKAQERIVQHLAPKENEVLVEVGPGTGLLTKHLLESPLRKLIAFELDTRAIPELRQEFAGFGERLELIEQDFLTVDLKALSATENSLLRVAGNIPYYITSPILFKLVDEKESVTDATLLVQLEVAERLSAKPRTKEYGIPTVLLNFFGEVKYLFKVPRGAFRPVPNVDSAVIQVNFRNDYFTRSGVTPPVGFEPKQFQKLVRAMFAMRRKTLRNNLKAYQQEGVAALEASERGVRFLTQRAEELSVQEFLELYTLLQGSLAAQPSGA